MNIIREQTSVVKLGQLKPLDLFKFPNSLNGDLFMVLNPGQEYFSVKKMTTDKGTSYTYVRMRHKQGDAMIFGTDIDEVVIKVNGTLHVEE